MAADLFNAIMLPKLNDDLDVFPLPPESARELLRRFAPGDQTCKP